MKAIIAFIKATLVGGILFLVPLLAVVLLLREAVAFAARILHPIAQLLPAEDFVGIAAAELLAVVVIIVLCFVAGLFAELRLGRMLGDTLERAILRRIPGFTFLKSIMHGAAGLEANSDLSVALARIEDAWVLSFVVERHASGLSTVFVPSAPTPAAGSIYYLTEDRVKHLDVSVSAAVACIMRLGVGSRDLLDKARWEPAQEESDAARGGADSGAVAR